MATVAPPHGARHAASLVRAIAERVLVLDGATGTWLQAQDLGPDDFGGPDLEGCNEILVDTRPDLVRAMHRDYLAAGADIIETNTFGGTPIVLAEYDLAPRARELNATAARLARAEADAHKTRTAIAIGAAYIGRPLIGPEEHAAAQVPGAERTSSVQATLSSHATGQAPVSPAAMAVSHASPGSTISSPHK